MTTQITWDSGNFVELAHQVRDAYFSFRQLQILSCPTELRTRCWDKLRPPFWDEDAATILMFLYRVVWEDQRDVVGAVELKRLFELALPTDRDFARKVVLALISQTHHEVKSTLRRKEMSEELYATNPMYAIECCFLGIGELPETFLKGGIMLTAYRSTALDSEPTPFLATLIALREAYAYFYAGQPAAAVGSLLWAKPHLTSIEPDLEPEQATAIGQYLSATAHAAEHAEHFDDSQVLLQEALRYLPPKGEGHARCHYSIGREHERRGKLHEAMRSYETALTVPGVEDSDLPKIIRMSLSFIRAELESNCTHMAIDQQLVSEFGESLGFTESIQHVLQRLAANEEVPDADVHSVIHAIQKWLSWRDSNELHHQQCLRMTVAVLKMCLSLKQQTSLPIPYSQLLIQGEAYFQGGDEASRVEFRTIRDHLNVQLNLKRQATEASRSRAVKQCEELEQASILAHIAAISEPTERLESLRLHVLAKLLELANNNDYRTPEVYPLLEAIEMAATAVNAARKELITAEQSGFVRESVDGLLCCINTMLLVRWNVLHGQKSDDGALHVDIQQLSNQESLLVASYVKLLRLMMNWRLEFFSIRRFHHAIESLPREETAELATLNDLLATFLWRSSKIGPSALRDPKVYAALDRVRELRTLAQTGGSGHVSESPIVPDLPRDSADLFLVELLPAPQHLFGIVGIEANRFHLWWSASWTKLADECDQLLKEFNVRSDWLDSLILKVHSKSEYRLERLLDNEKNCDHIKRVSYHNLTRAQVPLDCLIERVCPQEMTIEDVNSRQRKTVFRISFWGDIKYRENVDRSVDEGMRTIFNDGQALLRYPELPSKPIRVRGNTLLFGSYERWFFEDLNQRSNVRVAIHSEETATRSAFLANDWSNESALHLSTHGDAVTPYELSNLMLAQSDGFPSRIHFLDILTRNWTNLELVVLNACLSQAGTKLVGESALSLAWAFLAGGAKNVIACRWPVEDATGWYFTKCFYDTLLNVDQPSSVHDSFHVAQTMLRDHPQFCRPSQWGAFVLMESQANLETHDSVELMKNQANLETHDSVELFSMSCPNCGKETVSGLVYECQWCHKVLCRQNGCALQNDSLCPHCRKHAGYADNCFDLLQVRSRHGISRQQLAFARKAGSDESDNTPVVFIYHPGHIPGRSDPVPHDVVSFLTGDQSTCSRHSAEFKRSECNYWEVGRFKSLAEAQEYVKNNGLRELF